MKMQNYKKEENLQAEKKIKKNEDMRESVSNEYDPLDDLHKVFGSINETEDIDNPLYKKDELIIESV